jgi:hypothetical protein
MATLYEIEPDNLKIIDYTHFDCWFEKDEEDDEDLDETLEQYASVANEVIAVWEQSLNIKLPRPNFLKDGISLGFEVVCEAIVNAGYSVYHGDEFIEIYAKEVTQ